MKLIVFSIRDNKASAFGTPFFQQTRGVALRSFLDLARDSKSTIAQHPDDYSLFEVGSFDLESGKLSSHDTPEYCARASELLTASAA